MEAETIKDKVTKAVESLDLGIKYGKVEVEFREGNISYVNVAQGFRREQVPKRIQ